MIGLGNSIRNYNEKIGEHGYTTNQTFKISSKLKEVSEIFKKNTKGMFKPFLVSGILLVLTYFFIFLLLYLCNKAMNSYILEYKLFNGEYQYLNIDCWGIYKINENFNITSVTSFLVFPIFSFIALMFLIISYIMLLVCSSRKKYKNYIFYEEYKLIRNKSLKKWMKPLFPIVVILGLILIIGFSYLFFIMVYPPNFKTWYHPFLETNVSIKKYNFPNNYSVEKWNISFKLPLWTFILFIFLIVFWFIYIFSFIIYVKNFTSSFYGSIFAALKYGNGFKVLNDITEENKKILMDMLFENEVWKGNK